MIVEIESFLEFYEEEIMSREVVTVFEDQEDFKIFEYSNKKNLIASSPLSSIKSVGDMKSSVRNSRSIRKERSSNSKSAMPPARDRTI